MAQQRHQSDLSAESTSARQGSRILIVEDDLEIARMLGDTLTDNGMTVEIAESGVQMNAALRTQKFDLIVLDVMLPGENGLNICRRLRAATNIPILMLTALGEEIDRIFGLKIGADDYVTKPFSARELTARIRALLRRTAYDPDERDWSKVLRFNGWRLDPIRRQLHDPNNARVTTTTHEFDLLLAFCRNAGRVLSREELLGVTHAGLAGPIERSVDVHISRIRRKIEKDARDPVLLRTVRLGGYIFTATVEEA
ncbi:response regulator transcription factor [Mesorhizobium sp. XAP10]|uniref:response regulator n=1 Tax=unclassified Mesorhizobium TaxID=325217 RepID=UPI0023DFC748|nr:MULTISPECIES: response regulator transcription factor [unclassified Mesorhizobium]MDF3155532.1 response regulator transcription factor [Mesorhizobium sp. XAP10]MDF3248739.1 response regulator transcription factor [Mesorhizobium sp. XAP4]